MQRVLLIMLFVSFTSQGWSQQVYSHQTSKTPDIARFEIVQSESGARDTFKFDKYNGTLYQLVKTSDDDLV